MLIEPAHQLQLHPLNPGVDAASRHRSQLAITEILHSAARGKALKPLQQ